MVKIENLLVENYRGSSTRLHLKFEKNKNIVLIFGENGTGKTSIVDALDAFGNCSKGSLEDKSSTKAREHLPTIGKKPDEIQISVISGESEWNTALMGSNFVTTPQGRPKIHVLRRSHLQRLIEAEPAKRYEALRHFIDVGKVEQSENALHETGINVKNELEATDSLRRESEDQLKAIWEAEGKPSTNFDDWAKMLADQDTNTLDNDAQKLRRIQTIINTAENALSAFKQTKVFANQKETELQSVNEEIKKLPGVNVQQTISLANLLQKVSEHLKSNLHTDECPVCRQGIRLSQLKTDILIRLNELKPYNELQMRHEAAIRNIAPASQDVENKTQKLLTAARSLFDIAKNNEIKIISENIKLTNYIELSKKEDINVLVAPKESEQLIGIFSSLKQELINEETVLSKRSGVINSIRIQYNNIKKSVIKFEELSKLRDILREVYDISRLTRIEFTQAILDEIAVVFIELCQNINPCKEQKYM
jgi:DNA repair exonuclease SbcCD ATPase subunit